MENFQKQGNSLISFVCLELSAGLIGHEVGVSAHFHYLLEPAVEVSSPSMWCGRSPACPHNTCCVGLGAFFTNSHPATTAAFLQIEPTIIIFAKGSRSKP
jgi:hypothetical protein